MRRESQGKDVIPGLQRVFLRGFSVTRGIPTPEGLAHAMANIPTPVMPPAR